MDPSGGPPHSFPRTTGGPEAVNRGAHQRRGPRRRSPRPPAWVRAPLVSSQRPSFSSSSITTNRSSDVQQCYTCALQPITRFSHPQDPRIPDGLPNSALMDNRFIREIVHLLNDAPPDQREQLFWDVCSKLVEFMHLPSPAHRIFQSRHYLRPQTELAVYNPTNRYQHEFEEEEELGHGGFGRVVRARNKLDGHYYAIKMIITEDLGELSPETCVQEVRTLAKFDHPQVVRYYTAWVQHEVWPQHSKWASATVRELGSDTSDDSSADSSIENSASPRPPPACEGDGTPSDDSVVFQDTGTREVEVQPPSFSAQSIQQQSRQTQGHTQSQESAKAGGALLPYKPWLLPCHRKILYIQMRLCGESLRKWMDDRNTSESPEVVESQCLRIFHQLLKATCYIHQKGYMHRDIKPANILFTLEGGDIQLGDFGLARLIAHPPNAPPVALNTSLTPVAPQNYTLNVGTPLYTAPEVKWGNYGQKSDMYSLGIILLELFMPFKTNSERSFVINSLKATGNVDPELRYRWPFIACCIKRLTDKDPANRPSAMELLESPLFPQPLPPPSPTTTTIAEDTGTEAFSRLTLANTPQVVEAAATAVEVIKSEFTSVNTLEINQIKTKNSVSNCSVRIEERLSKDEQIAILREENDALKRRVADLERDLDHRKNNDALQADEK